MSELVRCQSSLNIIADFHPCQGLGFNCLHLYDPLRLVNIAFAAVRLVMNALVVWISIRCIKESPIKYYTLNLLAACFICDTLLTIRECLLIVYLYRNFFATAITLNIFNAAIRFSTDVVVAEYRNMSLFVVFAMYMLFITPLRMHRFLSGRTWQLFFIGSHIASCIASVPRSIGYFAKDMRTETRVIVEYIVYALLVIIATLTLIITTLGIIAVLRYNQKRKRGDEEESTNNRRLNLLSFIIYCTPLNVLNIPVCLSAIITFLRIFLPDFINGLHLQLSLPCDAGNEVIQARTIVICLSTIIALTPYRYATLRIFCKRSNKAMRLVSVSTVKRISFVPTTVPL